MTINHQLVTNWHSRRGSHLRFWDWLLKKWFGHISGHLRSYDLSSKLQILIFQALSRPSDEKARRALWAEIITWKNWPKGGSFWGNWRFGSEWSKSLWYRWESSKLRFETFPGQIWTSRIRFGPWKCQFWTKIGQIGPKQNQKLQKMLTTNLTNSPHYLTCNQGDPNQCHVESKIDQEDPKKVFHPDGGK